MPRAGAANVTKRKRNDKKSSIMENIIIWNNSFAVRLKRGGGGGNMKSQLRTNLQQVVVSFVLYLHHLLPPRPSRTHLLRLRLLQRSRSYRPQCHRCRHRPTKRRYFYHLFDCKRNDGNQFELKEKFIKRLQYCYYRLRLLPRRTPRRHHRVLPLRHLNLQVKSKIAIEHEWVR